MIVTSGARDRAADDLFTSIFPARRRMALASCHACMRSSVSMSTPNAFSTRGAISGDWAALPFYEVGESGAPYTQRLGRFIHAQAQLVQNFIADELAGMRGVMPIFSVSCSLVVVL